MMSLNVFDKNPDANQLDEALTNFLTEHAASSAFIPHVTSLEAKAGLMDNLLYYLQPLGVYSTWPETLTAKALQTLKVFAREVVGSDAIYSERGSSVILFHGGLAPDTLYTDTMVNQEAVKCLCNILLQDMTACLRIGGELSPDQFAHAIKVCNSGSGLFILCRILFIVTARTRPLARGLVEADLAQSLAQKLELVTDGQIKVSEPLNVDIVSNDILKGLFNLAMILSEDKADGGGFMGMVMPKPKLTELDAKAHPFTPKFESTLSIVKRFVMNTPVPSMPIEAPMCHAIHVLMNFRVGSLSSIWFPEGDYAFLDLLLNMFEKSMHILFPLSCRTKGKKKGADSNATLENEGDLDDCYRKEIDGMGLDESLPPILITLQNLAAGDATARKKMLARLAPSDLDRSIPLKSNPSVTGILIALMTCVTMLKVRDCVSELLFILFDENASKLTSYVGYGNAAGFLMSRGVMAAPEGSSDPEGSSSNPQVNPITGEIETGPKVDPCAGMTEEEKEREAEKLYVLLDRLQKNGTIQVQRK